MVAIEVRFGEVFPRNGCVNPRSFPIQHSGGSDCQARGVHRVPGLDLAFCFLYPHPSPVLFGLAVCGGGGDENDAPLSTAREVKATFYAAPPIRVCY